MHKLHSKSKINWSKKDLKLKYLLNGANFKDTYNRSTHTLFDHMKTQQLSNMNSKARFEGVITGNPYSEFSIQNLKPKPFSTKSSIDLGKAKIITNMKADICTIQSINNALNSDQKYSYIINRAAKYGRTKTIQKDNGGKSSRIQNKNNPFYKDFGFNTQSKLVDHESKRPQTSAVNHSRDLYDPITRVRSNKTSATKETSTKSKCNKSQTVSAFTHLGRIYAPNFSNEYQKAYTTNKGNFGRSKGMCSEMLNGCGKHAFIANTFGGRSQI